MPRATTKTRPKPRRRAAKQPARTATQRKRRIRKLNGIPLKRKIIWAYDTDSPEFKKRTEIELRDIRRKDAERDGMDFIDAVFADPEFQKWWR